MLEYLSLVVLLIYAAAYFYIYWKKDIRNLFSFIWRDLIWFFSDLRKSRGYRYILTDKQEVHGRILWAASVLYCIQLGMLEYKVLIDYNFATNTTWLLVLAILLGVSFLFSFGLLCLYTLNIIMVRNITDNIISKAIKKLRSKKV